MPYTRDFDLVIPDRAIYLPPDEILPGLREHLRAVGIDHPDRYDHFQIRIIVKPRYEGADGEAGIVSLFDRYSTLPRSQKRRAFSTVDSVFVSLTTPDDAIVMREIFPPTTDRTGQAEMALGANLTVGAGGSISGAKAAAEIHAKIKKEFRIKDFTVVSQKNEKTAIWDFRKSWFEDGRQPEVYITCSVPKTLDETKRYVKCQRRVTAGGRAVIKSRSAKKIMLG